MPRPKKHPLPEVLLDQAPNPVPDSLVEAIRDESRRALELLHEFDLHLPVSVIPGMRPTMQAHVNPTRSH
jgi:hypothetical protein